MFLLRGQFACIAVRASLYYLTGTLALTDGLKETVK